MRRHKSKKHIYYTGGLISLFLLPILCIFYFQSIKAFNKTHIIEISWSTEESWKAYEQTSAFFLHPDIDFLEISLNSNDKDNKIKLDYAQLEIRRIIKTKDTTKGVHFLFQSNAKYWTLIRAFDICNIENAYNYVPFKNHVWMFYYNPRPNPNEEKNRSFCGNADFAFGYGPMRGGLTYEQQIENAKTANEKFILRSLKTFWLVGVLIIILTFFSLRRTMKQRLLTKEK